MNIENIFSNDNIVAAYKLVEIGYEKNPEKPFSSKIDKKFHQDEVRDHLTGDEFATMYLYVKARGNGKPGTGSASLTLYRDLVQQHLRDTPYNIHDADVFETFKQSAFNKNDHNVDLDQWRKAVMGVYKAALTLMVEHHEYDANNSTFNMLFDRVAI